jgi:hypothetical protein
MKHLEDTLRQNKLVISRARAGKFAEILLEDSIEPLADWICFCVSEVTIPHFH